MVTNLKQLTYRVSGTFKFNKSNFICNGNVEGQDVTVRRRPQNEQSGLFFYHFRRLPSVLCSLTAGSPPPFAVLSSSLGFFIFFYFTFYFIPFGSRPRSLTFERVPRGPHRPVRTNNTRKLHWDSFYFVFAFFFSSG